MPVFVWFLLEGGTEDRAIAFVAFALASVTDLLDGELARRRSLITDFGKIADPIADKALTGSALITLSYLGELAWWITAVIVVRELAVTGLRFWVIRHGVIAASRGGKAKTMLQIIAISLYILPWHIPAGQGDRHGGGSRGDRRDGDRLHGAGHPPPPGRPVTSLPGAGDRLRRRTGRRRARPSWPGSRSGC